VSRPKILVLGAGGTGGYFGGRLAESGADVTFLVRNGRRKSLSEQGLRIESQFGDAQIEVKTAVAAEVAPVYDAAILTCKAYDLDAAVNQSRPRTDRLVLAPNVHGLVGRRELLRRGSGLQRFPGRFELRLGRVEILG
jgi:ketopantoate reductase